MNKQADLKQMKANATKAAALLKALAHDQRLLILCQLVEQEKSVSELMEHSELSQSAFSQHLAKLRQDGLVKTRKQAQVVYYSLDDANALKILEVLYQMYCA